MQTQETLVILKPDSLEKNLIGEIIKRYEDSGLKVKDMKFILDANNDLISKHYPDTMAESLGKKSENAGEKIDDFKEQGMKILNWNRDYMTRGPIIAMVLIGDNAILNVRKITGYTDPTEAEKGTIRGDLGVDSILKANNENRAVENLIHASGSIEEADNEIKLWFS